MKRVVSHLTFQVLVAIVIGVLVGMNFPAFAPTAKLISQTFINMIKMVIAPIIFLTIVTGIGKVSDIRQFGRIGGKALLYFITVTTLALFIGLVVGNLVKPGAGLDTAHLNKGDVSEYVEMSKEKTWVDHITEIVPPNVLGAFAEGNLLQVLFFSILFGIGIAQIGDSGQNLLKTFDKILQVLFKIMAMIMVLAPLGAFGGMAYTVGKYGLGT